MILVSKFLEGAWIVVLLIPLLLAAFRTVKEHYREVARELHERCLEAVAHVVSARPGGHGAARSLIEDILRAQGRWDGLIAAQVHERP